MAFKLNSGNNPSFKMMGAESPKKKMETPMDMGHSPKKFNEKLETAVKEGKIKGEFANAINNASDSPKEMKSPMELERESATEMEAAMKLKSAMDMAKDGPMNLMEESPKKLTQDAAMKMAAAMKKFYNKD
jgi:hypothetical protein